MRTAALISTLAAVMLGAGPAAGAEGALLQDGAYEVNVRLELPHVEDTGVAAGLGRICVTAANSGTHGLVALGGGNPLRGCPASNVRRDGPVVTFDIVCPGGDGAVGAARYTLWAERFEGAIAVKMGGKNMTMVERQSGHRIGRCEGEQRP